VDKALDLFKDPPPTTLTVSKVTDYHPETDLDELVNSTLELFV